MPNEHILEIAGMSIHLNELTSKQRAALYTSINKQAKQLMAASRIGQQLTASKVVDSIAELTTEIAQMMPAPVKPPIRQFKPIIIPNKPAIMTNPLAELQKNIDKLIEQDKQNFQVAFGFTVEYTSVLSTLSSLVRQNYHCKDRTEKINKFIKEHDAILKNKHALLSEQILIQKNKLQILQEEIIDKQKKITDELMQIEEKLKQAPKLTLFEKAYMTHASACTLAQRLIVKLTKRWYPDAHITTVEQRQKERSRLLQRKQAIPKKLNPYRNRQKILIMISTNASADML